MQNFYLHCITCHVLLYIFISGASSLGTQNSVNDLIKMANDLQKYYISQTSDVKEPEYFLDSFSSQKDEDANNDKYVDISRENQNKEDPSNRRIYPLIDFIKAVDRPVEDYNTHRIFNLKIRTNAKRNAEIKDEKHVEDQEFENKIKEMNLANNPDALVEVFINILKNKYPEKLLEMKNLLDKLAISGELNCSDDSIPLKEKIQPTTINSDMISSRRRITSTTNVYSNIMNSATAESDSSTSLSISNSTNHVEQEGGGGGGEEEEEEEEEGGGGGGEEEEEEEEEEGEGEGEGEADEDDNYDDKNEDDAESDQNLNNVCNPIQIQMKEKLKYKKEEAKPISVGREKRKKKTKSIIKSVSPFTPYIMPTFTKEISKNFISFTANNSDVINNAKASSTTEINSDEQEEASTNDIKNEIKAKKGTSKWRLQLQTQQQQITSTETKDITTETIGGPQIVNEQILVSSIDPVNSLINATTSVDELIDDTSFSKETTINNAIDTDAFNEENKTNFELDSQNKNYLRRRYSKRRNRKKRIRYLNGGTQRHRKKYKGI